MNNQNKQVIKEMEMIQYKQMVMQGLPEGINLNLKFDWREEVNHMAIKGKNISSEGNI